MKNLIITAVIFLTATQFLNAQATYKLAESPDVSIKILGSSNVHDWTMTSTAMGSKGVFTFEGGNELKHLSAFSFEVAVKSLKSGHGSMDSRTYKTVNADQYPKISYKLTSAIITPLQKNKYLIKAKGDLVIAGVSQPILMEVTAVVNADNTITCTGSEKLKLTDYNIKPPSFMLGAMKVTNDLVIQFNLVYTK